MHGGLKPVYSLAVTQGPRNKWRWVARAVGTWEFSSEELGRTITMEDGRTIGVGNVQGFETRAEAEIAARAIFEALWLKV